MSEPGSEARQLHGSLFCRSSSCGETRLNAKRARRVAVARCLWRGQDTPTTEGAAGVASVAGTADRFQPGAGSGGGLVANSLGHLTTLTGWCASGEAVALLQKRTSSKHMFFIYLLRQSTRWARPARGLRRAGMQRRAGARVRQCPRPGLSTARLEGGSASGPPSAEVHRLRGTRTFGRAYDELGFGQDWAGA